MYKLFLGLALSPLLFLFSCSTPYTNRLPASEPEQDTSDLISPEMIARIEAFDSKKMLSIKNWEQQWYSKRPLQFKLHRPDDYKLDLKVEMAVLEQSKHFKNMSREALAEFRNSLMMNYVMDNPDLMDRDLETCQSEIEEARSAARRNNFYGAGTVALSAVVLGMTVIGISHYSLMKSERVKNFLSKDKVQSIMQKMRSSRLGRPFVSSPVTLASNSCSFTLLELGQLSPSTLTHVAIPLAAGGTAFSLQAALLTKLVDDHYDEQSESFYDYADQLAENEELGIQIQALESEFENNRLKHSSALRSITTLLAANSELYQEYVYTRQNAERGIDSMWQADVFDARGEERFLKTECRLLGLRDAVIEEHVASRPQ